MPKGEDAIIRKKNKSIRKKLRSDSAKVSNRIAAIIAQKKRRQSGKRRMCQGMCFSLPTLEDPFNDKYMNLDSKKTKKVRPVKRDDNSVVENGSDDSRPKRKGNTDHKSNGKIQEQKRPRVEKDSTLSDEKSMKRLSGNVPMDVGCPSKFLISCLRTVQDTVRDDGDEAFERGKFLFFNLWGFEYWKCYTSGRHVLETSGCATMEQIAWIGSTAVDTITNKEKDGESLTCPFLLYIVPSQEKAAQVRTVLKPLKAFGIQAVSVHPGASIDFQIEGLKTCEPEFIICTPDRLVELVSMDAVDISGVHSLVIDAPGTSSGDAYIESIKSIQQHIRVDPHTVVFCNGSTDAYFSALSSLLPTPMCRLSLDKVSYKKSAT